MTGEQSNLPAAGWYDDPERPGTRRYWDGSQWTDQRQPGGAGSSPTGGGAADIDRKFKALRTAATVFHVVGWIVAIVGTLAVIAAAIAAGDDSGVSTFDDSDADPVAILIAGGLGVFLYSLMAFATAGIIRLMIAVEDNTRRTAEAVERLGVDRV